MDDKKVDNILKTNLRFSILNIDIVNYNNKIINNKHILCRKDIKIINPKGWIFPCINCGCYTNHYRTIENMDLYMCRNCFFFINPTNDFITINYIKDKYIL